MFGLKDDIGSTSDINLYIPIPFFFIISVNSKRKKRSSSNPLEFVEDIKVFVSEANRLSWDQVFQNIGSNVGYVVKKVRRVSNHITSNLR